MTEAARPRHSIRFHGRSYHAMVLAPEPPVANWLAELDTWLERSPGFFFGRPVVLDLAVLQPGSKQGLTELLQNLAERNIKVMGIEGAEPAWLDFAMPPLLLSGRQTSVVPGDPPPAAAEAPAPAPFSDSAPDAAIIRTRNHANDDALCPYLFSTSKRSTPPSATTSSPR